MVQLVKQIQSDNFRNDEWLEFLGQLVVRFGEMEGIRDCAPMEWLVQSYESFKRVMEADANTYGGKVAEADRAADAAWRCLNAQLRLALLHPNASHRQAAARLYPLMKKYGDPTSLPYDQEYAILKDLLTDLSAADASDLEITHTRDWVVSLRERYDHFLLVYAACNAANAAGISNQIKMTRTDTERAYRALTAYLNASLMHSTPDDVIVAVTEINALIEHRKTTHQQSSDKESEISFAILDQMDAFDELS